MPYFVALFARGLRVHLVGQREVGKGGEGEDVAGAAAAGGRFAGQPDRGCVRRGFGQAGCGLGVIGGDADGVPCAAAAGVDVVVWEDGGVRFGDGVGGGHGSLCLPVIWFGDLEWRLAGE